MIHLILTMASNLVLVAAGNSACPKIELGTHPPRPQNIFCCEEKERLKREEEERERQAELERQRSNNPFRNESLMRLVPIGAPCATPRFAVPQSLLSISL